MNKIKLACLSSPKVSWQRSLYFLVLFLTQYKGSQIKQSQHIYQVISKSICNLKAVTACWTHLVPCFNWQKIGIRLPKWMLISLIIFSIFLLFPSSKGVSSKARLSRRKFAGDGNSLQHKQNTGSYKPSAISGCLGNYD